MSDNFIYIDNFDGSPERPKMIDNPFVKGYIWHADGPHSCELCDERDGQFFTAEDLPLDHPNGMCSMEPYIDTSEIIDMASDWQLNPDRIQDYFKDLDFRPSFD